MSPDTLAPPRDLSLPFFAYGVFKPGQLGFHQLKDLVDYVDSAAQIDGRLLIRDGLPILDLDSDGEGKINGALINFRPGLEEQAYQRIAAMEPQRQYRWGEVQAGELTANVLVGKSPRRGSVPLEGNEWDGKEDPLLTTGLAVVEEILEANGAFDWDLKPLFRLQMAYMLLWSAIERYLSLRYKMGCNPEARVTQLAGDPAFPEILKRSVAESREVIRADHPSGKETLDPDKPEKAVKYYYQVRCNATHRGKAAVQDHLTVQKSLSELLKIFRFVLAEAYSASQPKQSLTGQKLPQGRGEG